MSIGASHPLFGALSSQETFVEERIRTLALCVTGLAVLGAVLHWLKAVLVPLTLALAMRHLLQPIIDFFTKRPIRCSGVELCAEPLYPRNAPTWLRVFSDCACRLILPHWLAVLVTLCFASGVFGILCIIVLDSVKTFSARADTYSEQIKRIFEGIVLWLDQRGLNELMAERLKEFSNRIPITQLVMAVVEGLISLLSNFLLVLLFTVYLMLGSDERDAVASATGGLLSEKVDDQIRLFIKGKVLLSLLVGILTAIIFYLLHLELWLVFAVFAFWLNFIPNIGAFVATLLPVPVVAFDPNISWLSATLAVVLPFAMHAVVGNVVEPLIFGHSLDLHPVVVLLSLMLWGALWGVPGLVLAVPVTAVIRIHLKHIDHPLPKYIAAILVGRTRPGDSSAASDTSGDEFGYDYSEELSLESGRHPREDDPLVAGDRAGLGGMRSLTPNRCSAPTFGTFVRGEPYEYRNASSPLRGSPVQMHPGNQGSTMLDPLRNS